MKKTLKNLKQDYFNFLKSIPDNLDKAKKLIGVSELDFSFSEIDFMQKLYEENFRTPETLELSFDELAIIFDTYIGEAFMHHNKGNWELCILKSDDAYGTPIILNWGEDNYSHISISTYVWRVRIEKGKFKGSISEKIKVAKTPYKE